MPLSFPASPTVNQQSVQNGRTFAWTGAAWELVAETAADPRWNLFLPAAPTGLTVTAGNAQASLSWTAPTGVIAQAPITDYVVQFSSDSGSTWSTFADAVSTTASVTVTGLTNGTAYVFRVAAINGVGVGAFTAASAAVTPSAPPPVTLNSGSGSGTAASKWNQFAGPWPACDFQGRFITANATVTVLVDSYSMGDSCGCDGESYYTIQHRNASNAVLVNTRDQTFSNRSFTLAAGDYLYIDITCSLRGYRAWVP
jgi:hypothetical protein